MASSEFDIDSRNKLGVDERWDDGTDFDHFVNALNNGVTVRTGGVPSEVGTPADLRDDALALSELRALFAQYR